ncbi:hypothetical protein [Priestia megaterium]|uniref:hypothetical protein n=1 Tax=Priestia megaterium TaxID=1404 RepID=UPI0023DCBC1D|nr:hypothetical protein [Priestia megaterium]MDF2010237.1 hypothetical protein [Priestia megaterium]
MAELVKVEKETKVIKKDFVIRLTEQELNTLVYAIGKMGRSQDAEMVALKGDEVLPSTYSLYNKLDDIAVEAGE